MEKKTEAPQSPILKTYKKLRDRDYPLVVRVIDRHLVVTSPDFQFPIPIVVPYDPPSVEMGGKALIAGFLQIAEYLNSLERMNEDPPAPSRLKTLFPKLTDEVSLKEACHILGMKPDMVRGLADEGRIPSSRTPKGHRRFSREKLREFVRTWKT
jgi:excisionase family DNA binding protein